MNNIEFDIRMKNRLYKLEYVAKNLGVKLDTTHPNFNINAAAKQLSKLIESGSSYKSICIQYTQR